MLVIHIHFLVLKSCFNRGKQFRRYFLVSGLERERSLVMLLKEKNQTSDLREMLVLLVLRLESMFCVNNAMARLQPGNWLFA